MKSFLCALLLFSTTPLVSLAMPPQAPEDLLLTNGISQQINATWTAPIDEGSPITDYRIEYKRNTDTSWTVFSDEISAIPHTTINGLMNGLLYDVRVFAINLDGISSVSSVATHRVIDPTPTAPVISAITYDTVLALSGFPITVSYEFLDSNGDTDISTLVWTRSVDRLGPYTPIPFATDATYTPTSDDIGYFLRVDMIPTSDVAPFTGVSVMSEPTVIVAEPDYINHILSAGQSLAIGTKAVPPLSTTQPYNNLMLTGHPSSGWGVGTSLVPLVEAHWETPGSGMANMLSFLNGDFDVAIGLHGFNAVRYTQIKKGTAFYNKGMLQLANTKLAAAALGRPHRVLGVTLIHGETDDFINTPGDVYAGYLAELQSDYQSDIQATTGQTETIPLFTDQESSFTSNYYVNKATSEIPLAQLQASIDNPGEIVLVTPKYFLKYDPDGVHLTPKSSRWLGEYYGKVINEVTVRGHEWKPLMPKAGMLIGNILYLDYHVPKGSLVFDTSLVTEHENYGFEYYDETHSVEIVDVDIMSDSLLKITLSGAPTGVHKKIRYAYRGVQGTHTDPSNPNSIGGNLRDTDDAPSLHGNTLYNWAVQGEWNINELPMIM